MGIRYHFIDSGFPLVYIFLLDLVGHLLLFRLFSKVLPFLKKLFIQALNLRSFADLNLIACACLKSTCRFASRFIVRLHCNFMLFVKHVYLLNLRLEFCFLYIQLISVAVIGG